MTDSRRNPEQKTSSQGPLPPYDVVDRHSRPDIEDAYSRYVDLRTIPRSLVLYVTLMRIVNMGLHTGRVDVTVQYFLGSLTLEEIRRTHPTSAVPMSAGMYEAVGHQNLHLILSNQAPNSAVLFRNENKELQENRRDARRAGHRYLEVINGFGVAGTLAGGATDIVFRAFHRATTAGRTISGIAEIGFFAAIQIMGPSTAPRPRPSDEAQASTPDARRNTQS